MATLITTYYLRNYIEEEYRITNAAFEDKVLDLQGSVIADGTPILFWGYHGGENQKWQFLET